MQHHWAVESSGRVELSQQPLALCPSSMMAARQAVNSISGGRDMMAARQAVNSIGGGRDMMVAKQAVNSVGGGRVRWGALRWGQRGFHPISAAGTWQVGGVHGGRHEGTIPQERL